MVRKEKVDGVLGGVLTAKDIANLDLGERIWLFFLLVRQHKGK